MARVKITPDHPDFPHGTYAGFGRGCRCETCKAANRDYNREYARKRAQAKRDVQAKTSGEGTDHSEAVKDAGPQAAAPSTPPAVSPPEPHPQATTARPAPHPTPPDVTGRTAALGASRRLQGLIFMGYTPVELAQHTRISVDNIWWLLIQPPETILDVTHRTIVNTYKDLALRPPAAEANAERRIGIERSKLLAEQQNWVSGFAWKQIDVDEEVAFPPTTPRQENDSSTRRKLETARQTIKDLRIKLAAATLAPVPPPVNLTDELVEERRKHTEALDRITELEHSLTAARTALVDAQKLIQAGNTLADNVAEANADLTGALADAEQLEEVLERAGINHLHIHVHVDGDR